MVDTIKKIVETRNRWDHWWMRQIKKFPRLGSNVIATEHDRLASRLNDILVKRVAMLKTNYDYSTL